MQTEITNKHEKNNRRDPHEGEANGAQDKRDEICKRERSTNEEEGKRNNTAKGGEEERQTKPERET